MILTALSSVKLCTVFSTEHPDIVRIVATIALIVSVLTVFIILVIFYNRVEKRKSQKVSDAADETIMEELTDHIFNYDSVNDIPQHELNATVKQLNAYKNKNDALRDSVIKLLVYFQRNLTGAVARMISSTYSRLKLRKFTLQKLRSNYWFYKTQGLAEVQGMKDSHSLPDVYKLLTDKNQDVRLAAYNVLITLKDKRCFDFLTTETEELSDWHQIMLHDTIVGTVGLEVPDFKSYLTSSNTSIVLLCIKLIVDYKQFDAVPKLMSIMDQDNESVRNQIIIALGHLQAENVEDSLIEQYGLESIKNKAAILIALGRIGSGQAEGFIKDKFLEAEHFQILKSAAYAIISHPEHRKEKILNDLPDMNNDQRAILRHFAEPWNTNGGI